MATFFAIIDALDGVLVGPAPGEGIGLWLRRLRHDRGLPQYRAAQLAGLTIPTIAALEGGGGRLGSLQRLLAAYGTELSVCAAESAPERRHRLLTGDARVLIPQIESSSIDAVITDPPYALGRIDPAVVIEMVSAWVRGDDAAERATASYLRQHMADEWDDDIPQPSLWREAYRVLKPGAHVVAFAAPRNAFLTAIALTVAGFELRDPVYWLHGAGMRGGRDVGRTLAMRALRARMPEHIASLPRRRFRSIIGAGRARAGLSIGNDEIAALLPETVSELERLSGIRDGLRSGAETIIVARKPFDGTMSDNVARHGVGGVRVRDGRWRSHDGQHRDPMNVIGDFEGGEHLHPALFIARRWRPTICNQVSTSAYLQSPRV